jgi:DNA-binding NtrC family response regulator
MLKRILFVDDEANVLFALRRQFRKQYEIETALGPVVGLRFIAEGGPFAVVVSDFSMAGMDGVAFLAQVSKISPKRCA